MNIKSIANTALKKHRYNGVKKGYNGLYKKMLSHISIDTASNMVVGGGK